MRALMLVLLVVAGCDPNANGRPETCLVPVVGSTCVVPPLDQEAFVRAAAWCPADAELVIDERPGGDVELACEPAAGGWRIVVGVVAAGWGVAYLAPDASLVVCIDGRVDAVMPLLSTPDRARYWHQLSIDDGACLLTGECVVVDACLGEPV